MSAIVVVAVLIVAWVLAATLVLALCRMAAHADAGMVARPAIPVGGARAAEGPPRAVVIPIAGRRGACRAAQAART